MVATTSVALAVWDAQGGGGGGPARVAAAPSPPARRVLTPMAVRSRQGDGRCRTEDGPSWSRVRPGVVEWGGSGKDPRGVLLFGSCCGACGWSVTREGRDCCRMLERGRASSGPRVINMCRHIGSALGTGGGGGSRRVATSLHGHEPLS